jgi:hypothetical protein
MVLVMVSKIAGRCPGSWRQAVVFKAVEQLLVRCKVEADQSDCHGQANRAEAGSASVEATFSTSALSLNKALTCWRLASFARVVATPRS